jgi:hypothetical protein
MIRQKESKALVNDNIAALNKYKIERDRIRKIDDLSKEVREIKVVLASVCKKLESIESI